MRKPYEDEQRLFLVAEMQRPAEPESDPLEAARGIAFACIMGLTIIGLIAAWWKS